MGEGGRGLKAGMRPPQAVLGRMFSLHPGNLAGTAWYGRLKWCEEYGHKHRGKSRGLQKYGVRLREEMERGRGGFGLSEQISGSTQGV